MRIVVLVKQVPDTYRDRRLSLQTGLADRAGSEAVLDEIGERALEVGLSYADSHPGTDVVVVSVGPATASAGIRRTLAMGASSAVHVIDDSLVGADLSLTAEVLAAAVTRAGYDLIMAGNLSTDGLGGVIPAMVAELLDLPQLTALNSLSIAEQSVSGVRIDEFGSHTVSAPLPAVVSITEALPDARFPSFTGIMAAKKKPLETVTLPELGIDPGDGTAARSIVVAVTEKPPRASGVKISDDGDAGTKVADFLIQNRLAQ
jgi:electron transfer flavoprotein beta subunit